MLSVFVGNSPSFGYYIHWNIIIIIIIIIIINVPPHKIPISCNLDYSTKHSAIPYDKVGASSKFIKSRNSNLEVHKNTSRITKI